MIKYLQFGPLILVKLHFGPCFWKIIVLVPTFRRLYLFLYALESFICVILLVYFVYLL